MQPQTKRVKPSAASQQLAHSLIVHSIFIDWLDALAYIAIPVGRAPLGCAMLSAAGTYRLQPVQPALKVQLDVIMFCIAYFLPGGVYSTG